MSPNAAPAGWDVESLPFHDGELDAQARVGVLELAEAAGRRGIRRYMPDQHRQFFAEQPFMVLGGLDAEGQPWATLRVGEPGFVTSPDPQTLRLAGRPLPDDPLADSWRLGGAVGALGIQPATRRRNRVNGVITALNEDAMTLRVSQSFGNCAKYIQGRTPTPVVREPAGPQRHGSQLDGAARAVLARADTFFIASANVGNGAGLAGGADVSHRGSEPGFVRVDNDLTLTTPDFAGNNYFNTLGNLVREPRAGLLFLDFDSGDVLYLAVRAEILWDSLEREAFPGAQRLVRFHIHEVRHSAAVLPFRWSAVEYAPQFALATLPRVEANVAPAPRTALTLKVVAVQDETAHIRSFVLAAVNGDALPAHAPGQFLTLRLSLPGYDAPVLRNYTLSDASNGRTYRISVKREGAASHWLHEQVAVGAVLEGLPPRGAFRLDVKSPRPIVLLSAGIGITPMMAMLNHLLATGDSSRRIYFCHGVRSRHERAFAAYLQAVAAKHPQVSVHLVNSEDASERPGPHRVGLALLKQVLPFDDYDFYLCGPASFMRDLYDGLRGMMIADERIRFESFGPSTVQRTRTLASGGDPAEQAALAQVHFTRSQRTAAWTGAGSLLDLAEAQGIVARSDCRSGSCGTCATRVLRGQVRYPETVDADIPPGHALICSSQPCVLATGEPVELALDL